MMQETIELLSFSLDLKFLYPSILSHKEILFFDIFLPLLSLTQREKEQFVDDEEEYMKRLDDYLNYRQSKTLRIKSANLCFQMNRCVDGMLFFVFDLLCKLINQILSGQSESSLE